MAQLQSTGVTGSLTVTGQITAQTLSVQQVTSSILVVTGSNKFGSLPSNTQEFTGSLIVTGSGPHYIIGGNLGIGTNSPAVKLDLIDNGAKGSGIDEAIIRIRSTDQLGASIHVSGSSNWRIISTGPTSTPGGGDLGFYSDNGALYRMVIQGADGNVGIGSTTVPSKLYVELSGAANQRLANFRNTGGNSFIEIQSSGTGAIGFWTAADNSFSIYQNSTAGTIGTSVLYVSSSTNVGIGTTAPGDKLTVYGAANAPLGTRIINATNGTAAYSYLSIGVAGSAINIFSYPSANSTRASTAYINTDSSVTNGLLVTTDAGPIRFSAASTAGSQLYITAAGNVGIGTTSPDAKLRVAGTLNATHSIFGNTDGRGLAIQTVLVAGTNEAGSILNARGVGSGTLIMQTDGTERVRIASDGNVGIGTTSPSSVLNVVGTTTITGKIIAGGVTATDGQITLEQLYSGGNVLGSISTRYSSGAMILGYGARGKNGADGYTSTFSNFSGRRAIFEINQGYFQFLNTAAVDTAIGSDLTTSTLVYIADTGNVGIGTTSPGSKLTVSGSIESLIDSYGEGGHLILRAQSGGTKRWNIDNYSSSDILRFFTEDDSTAANGSVKMTILSDGNVGIGSTSPAFKLDVSGNARFTTQIRVDGTDGNGYRAIGFGGNTLNTNPTIYSNGSYLVVTTATSQPLYLNSDSNGAILMSGTGNVGIGTNSPQSKLTIGASFATTVGLTIDSGDASDSQLVLRKAANKPAFGVLAWDNQVFLSSGIYYDGGSWIHNSDTNNNQLLLLQPGSGVRWYASSNGAGSWNVASNEQLWNDSAIWTSLVQSTRTGNSYFTGGSVGIGTTVPNYKLEVITSGTVGFRLQTATSTTGNPQIDLYDSARTQETVISSTDGTTVGTYIASFSNHPLLLGTYAGSTPTARLAISTTGNVGIGSVSPTSALDVVGNIQSYNARTKSYTSLTGASNDWFPIFTVTDSNDNGSIICTVRTYAHSSVTFSAARGYGPSQTHAITILNVQVNQNSDYANVTGVRIRESGQVEIQLTWSTGPQVNIGLQVIGSTNTPSPAASLATSVDSSTVVDTVTLSSGTIRSRNGLLAGSNVKLDNNGVSYLNGGSVGIGTTSPVAKFQIANNVGSGFDSFTDYQMVIYNTGNAATSYGMGVESSTMMFNSDDFYKFYVDNVAKVRFGSDGAITSAGDIIAYGSPSDITLKTNVKPLEDALEKINKLKGVSFIWKESEETKMTGLKEDIGFIAQEVQEVIPELVRKNDNGLLSLRDKGIIAYLVEAVKEQQKQIDELKYLLKNKQNGN